MISSLRSALQDNAWLRFIILFTIFMVGANRRDVLPAFGYPDAGLPRWIFAAVTATAFILHMMLSSKDPLWSPLADQPRIIRLVYAALFVVPGGIALTVVVAHAPLTSPLFLISTGVLLLVGAFEWVAKRKQAGQV